MNFQNSFLWSVEMEQALRKLWDDGLSAALCAAELSRVFRHRITRSAICGKVHRLGLVGRKISSSIDRQRAAVNAPRRAAKVVEKRTIAVAKRERDTRSQAQRNADADDLRAYLATEVASLTPEQQARAVTIFKLRPHSCRWPFGDPARTDFRFCGDVALPDRPYCTDHHRIAYRQPEARR